MVFPSTQNGRVFVTGRNALMSVVNNPVNPQPVPLPKPNEPDPRVDIRNLRDVLLARRAGMRFGDMTPTAVNFDLADPVPFNGARRYQGYSFADSKGLPFAIGGDLRDTNAYNAGAQGNAFVRLHNPVLSRLSPFHRILKNDRTSIRRP